MAASGTITDLDQFTEPAPAPADREPANGATFQDGLQDLANRTRYLKNQLDRQRGTLQFSLSGSVSALLGGSFTISDLEDPSGEDLLDASVNAGTTLLLPDDGPWCIWLVGNMQHDYNGSYAGLGIGIYDDDDDSLIQAARVPRNGDDAVRVAFSAPYLVSAAKLSFRPVAITIVGPPPTEST